MRRVLGRWEVMLFFLLTCVGCRMGASYSPAYARFERVDELSEPLAQGKSFLLESDNGYVRVIGSSIERCDVRATVTAWAKTEEAAEALAAKVQVRLVPSAKGLAVRIERPFFLTDQGVAVDLKVALPKRTKLSLVNHNGAIDVAGISQLVEARTDNGIIGTTDTGPVHLQTNNGSIMAKGISGDARLETNNGEVTLTFAGNAPGICNVSIVANNGNIDVTPPAALSAKVDVAVSNGAINANLPIAGQEMMENRWRGTVGKGEGRLHVATKNGSVVIR